MLRRNGRSAIAQRTGVAAPDHSPGAASRRLRTRDARNEFPWLARAVAHDQSAGARAKVIVGKHWLSSRPGHQWAIPPAQRIRAEPQPDKLTARNGSRAKTVSGVAVYSSDSFGGVRLISE